MIDSSGNSNKLSYAYPPEVAELHSEVLQPAPTQQSSSLLTHEIEPLIVDKEMTELLTTRRHRRIAVICMALAASHMLFALFVCVPLTRTDPSLYRTLAYTAIAISLSTALIGVFSTYKSDRYLYLKKKFIDESINEGNVRKIKWLLENGFDVDPRLFCEHARIKCLEAIALKQPDMVRAQQEILNLLLPLDKAGEYANSEDSDYAAALVQWINRSLPNPQS